MSHGSEDAEVQAPIVYSFHGAALEVVYQVRNHGLALRDLQNLRADATFALAQVEEKIQEHQRYKGPTHRCVDCEKPIPSTPGFGVRCGDCMDPGGSA